MRTFQQIIKAAMTMPAEDFHFKPHDDAPSFTNLVKQVLNGQHAACDEINGTSANERGKVPEETASQDEMIAALQVVSAACDKSYGKMTADNLAELKPSGNTQRARVSILLWNFAHNSELYGKIMEYLKEKGLKRPPPQPPAGGRR